MSDVNTNSPQPAPQEPPATRRCAGAAPAVDTREFVRFTRLHRALHACMIVSFITLALTGLDAEVLLHRLGGRFCRACWADSRPPASSIAPPRSSCSELFVTHLVDLDPQKQRSRTNPGGG